MIDRELIKKFLFIVLNEIREEDGCYYLDITNTISSILNSENIYDRETNKIKLLNLSNELYLFINNNIELFELYGFSSRNNHIIYNNSLIYLVDDEANDDELEQYLILRKYY
jgi:hypothetical protein